MVNKWADKSFKVYTEKGYLDYLRTKVYFIDENPPRELDSAIKTEFKKLIKGKDDEKLFRFLLTVDKRPINDSFFASFLKTGSNTRGPAKGRLDETIKNNPKTIKEICKRVRGLGEAKAIEAMEAPIMTSRQMGSKFRNWIKKEFPSEADESKFLRSKKKITVFDAPSDDKINAFVKKHLCTVIPRKKGGGDEKGIDLLIKIKVKKKETFVIGECKFITDNGGAQNNQFSDAIEFVQSSDFKSKRGFAVERCAIIDGVCWMEWKDGMMQKGIRSLTPKQHALSLHLLDKFLNSF